MEFIYILSNPNDPQDHKVGRHTGTYDKLLSRYRTYFKTCPRIFFFRAVLGIAACQIETELKVRIKTSRIETINGTLLEWTTMDLRSLITVVNGVFDEYDQFSESNYPGIDDKIPLSFDKKKVALMVKPVEKIADDNIIDFSFINKLEQSNDFTMGHFRDREKNLRHFHQIEDAFLHHIKNIDPVTASINIFLLITKRKFKAGTGTKLEIYEFISDSSIQKNASVDAGLYKLIEPREMNDIIYDETASCLQKFKSCFFMAAGEYEDRRQKTLLENASLILMVLEKISRAKSSLTKALCNNVKILDKRFVDKLNDDPSVINFRNGKLAWKTGKLKSRTSDDLFSQFIDTDYKHKSYDTSEQEKLILKMCKDNRGIYEECLELLMLKLSSNALSVDRKIFTLRWRKLGIRDDNKIKLSDMFDLFKSDDVGTSHRLVHLLLSFNLARSNN